MVTFVNSNVRIPINKFIEPQTGRPTQEWLLWLMNPSVMSLNIGTALPIESGGTGLTTLPTNGQLLIGNAGAYALNTLTAGAGISVTNGAGTITLANTGVLSFDSTTGLTPATATTGAVTLGGILNVANGGTGTATAAANTVFAGPTAGAAAAPAFRALTINDIPNLSSLLADRVLGWLGLGSGIWAGH